MSELASALPGVTFDGIARIEEAGLRGMITLKGDLASAKLRKAVTAATGVSFPAQGTVEFAEDRGMCWMASDELLLLTAHAEADDIRSKVSKSLGKAPHLAAVVSDARAVFRISGPGARETLAKLTPADLHPDSFGLGMIRRTRLAQVPAAFWLLDENTFELVCFRSVARYVFDLLSHAARPGTEVGAF